MTTPEQDDRRGHFPYHEYPHPDTHRHEEPRMSDLRAAAQEVVTRWFDWIEGEADQTLRASMIRLRAALATPPDPRLAAAWPDDLPVVGGSDEAALYRDIAEADATPPESVDPFVTINEKVLRDAWLRLDACGDPRTAHTLWQHLTLGVVAEPIGYDSQTCIHGVYTKMPCGACEAELEGVFPPRDRRLATPPESGLDVDHADCGDRCACYQRGVLDEWGATR